MSTLTSFSTITNSLTPSPSSTTASVAADPIASLLPKCDGPPYNAQPVIDSIPEIPKDLNVAMIGGTNVSFAPMVWCCYPNHVQLVNGCFLWCKIPEPADDSKKLQTQDQIFGNFTSCLRAQDEYDIKVNMGIQGNIPNRSGAEGMGRVSAVGLAMGVLALTSFLMG